MSLRTSLLIISLLPLMLSGFELSAGKKKAPSTCPEQATYELESAKDFPALPDPAAHRKKMHAQQAYLRELEKADRRAAVTFQQLERKAALESEKQASLTSAQLQERAKRRELEDLCYRSYPYILDAVPRDKWNRVRQKWERDRQRSAKLSLPSRTHDGDGW